MTTMTVQIRRKGMITLPVELRRQYGLDEGDVFTLTDLGDGSLLLVPRVSHVARLMDEASVEVEEVLETGGEPALFAIGRGASTPSGTTGDHTFPIVEVCYTMRHEINL